MLNTWRYSFWMRAFLSKNDVIRKEAARKLANNPVPNIDRKLYQQINRLLIAVRRRVRFHLEDTEYKPVAWLPHHSCVIESDDDWQYDLNAQLFDLKLDSDGFMTVWHDPKIKATNRIVCITWYENDNGDGFIIKKPVLSPLPCERWGRYPLTLSQWRPLAATLIEAEQLWRWVHGVRLYTDDPTFIHKGICGWHLEPTQRIINHRKLEAEGKVYLLDNRSDEEKQRDEDGWAGQILYRDIIAGFSPDESTQ